MNAALPLSSSDGAARRDSGSSEAGLERRQALRAAIGRLVPPVRRGRLCERAELLQSLADMPHTRVTLIIAPAGYGKTTLIGQWCVKLRQQQMPVAYYAASERDRDTTVFLTMLACAIAEAGIDAGQQPGFREGRFQEGLSLDDILLSLELAGQRLVLFIDDFERVNDPAISALMTRFIEAAPASVHLVIASRTFPAIPLSTLDVGGELRVIDTYQLRLRRDELAWMLDLDAEMPEVGEVAARTQGWPVTVELYRLWRERQGAFDSRATFGGHVAEVHNYLAEQLFSSLPQLQYDLLVDIADHEEVQADLVDAMRERGDSGALLQEIARGLPSLMRTTAEHQCPVYRLHPLLLDHLRQSLQENNDRRLRLSRNAARWFLDHQRYPEAIRSAFSSRDEKTIRLVLQSLRPIHILVGDGATTLRLILREVPEDVIGSHPRLQIMATLAHFKAGFFSEARAMLERIRQDTANFTRDGHGHAEWLGVEGHLTDVILLCQTQRCSLEVERICALAMASANNDPLIWASGENVMMLVQQIRGNLDAADAAIERARGVLNAIEPSRYAHAQIAGHQALVLLARGQLRRLNNYIGAYQKQPGQDLADDTSTPTLFKMIMAAMRYEQEFSESAVDALKTSLTEHSRTESWSDQYAITYPCVAVRLYLQGGLAPVLAFLDEAREHARRTGIEALPDLLDVLEIEYRARAGDLDEMTELAQRAGILEAADCNRGAQDARGWRERDAAAIARFRVAIARRDYFGAEDVARRLARSGHEGGRLRSELKGIIFVVLALDEQNDRAGALSALLDAVLLSYPEGFVAPFTEEGARIQPMVEALLAEPAIDAYARRHLEEIRRAIGRAMAPSDSRALNVREREIVAYLAEGLSNKVIARRMGITDHTVKFHLKKIFSKLDVSSRRAAVAKVQTVRTEEAAELTIGRF